LRAAPYRFQKLEELGIKEHFVQDNHSSSSKGTLRGFHYQLLHAQSKLCRVVYGKALDVVADVRLGSPHFGKWTAVVLSAESGNQIYVPCGFAHGFLALTERVDFLYKCSAAYDPTDEYGIRWNDPYLGVDWAISNPLLSEKDAKLPALSNICREFLPVYIGQ
jgi:dTDP-4-dehydrorhamnose 3,5-epimerase